MKSHAVWISRPVFVTSTFRDMQAERDWLHTHVFPALAERLRERYHHLEPIDLRWGVELTGADGQQAKELLVLKVCMDEIRRSRPFLIGLIGDRYGWTPPPERLQAAAQEAGFSGTLDGRSVTALEIEFGVLNSAGQKDRSRFYLREPLPYSEMGALAADYSDLHSGGPGAAEAHQRLEALKRRLRSELPGRVRTYRAEWDGVRVKGLETWGRMVLEDLWADLEEETREYVHAAPARWQQEEAWVLEQFAATQCPNFIGREESIRETLAFAAAPGETPWALAVTGDPGSGKSSFFGETWRRLLQRADCLVLAHAAAISTRAGSVDAMLRRWIGELAAHLGVDDPESGLQGREAVEKAFAEILSRAAVHGRVVCLIDALNQFERTPVARRLTWLPELWPANARLIATAVSGEESDALVGRSGVQVLNLPLLDRREVVAIVEAVCERSHKTLPELPLRALLTIRVPDGRAAARNPLWLLLALEELLLLDADDFARAERDYDGGSEERLAAMLADVARSFPPDVALLYATLLERAERAYGPALTRGVAELVALSRSGWRESDLAALLPSVTGELWDPLAFAALRRGFRSHLVQRGVSAQWNFAHSQMREAVSLRYLIDKKSFQPLHLGHHFQDHALCRLRHAQSAAYLGTLLVADLLRQREHMYHLISADDRPGAAWRYGDPTLSDGEASGATQALAARADGDEAWVASLPAQLDDPDRLAGIAKRFVFELCTSMENLTSVWSRLQVVEAASDAYERLRKAQPDNADYARGESACYTKLGDLQLEHGDARWALDYYKSALKIIWKLRRRAPDSLGYARDWASCYGRIGHVEFELGDLRRALKHQQKTLSLLEELCRRTPEDTDDTLAVALSNERLGDVYQRLGDLQGALESHRKASVIREHLWMHTDRPEYARDLSVSYRKVGDVQHSIGEANCAVELYKKSMALVDDLQRRAPDCADYTHYLSVTHGKLGDVHSTLGEAQQALECYQHALALAEPLRNRAEDTADYACNLGVCYLNLSKFYSQAGDHVNQTRLESRFIELLEEMGEIGMHYPDVFRSEYRRIKGRFPWESDPSAELGPSESPFLTPEEQIELQRESQEAMAECRAAMRRKEQPIHELWD